jgi:general secretion pathway protein H
VAPRTQARGFTLVELMIALAVMALLTAAVTPALSSLTGADARKAAGELSGSLRYLFDTAALRHATCRMAIDLDHRGYWAECAPGQVGVLKENDRSLLAPDDEELADRFPDERDAERRRLLAQTRFGAFNDRLLPKRALPGHAVFGEIKVEGRTEPVTRGMAYVHFFAAGQAQRAYIPVVDGSYRYTVVLEPFTGRARVVEGVVEADR